MLKGWGVLVEKRPISQGFATSSLLFTKNIIAKTPPEQKFIKHVLKLIHTTVVFLEFLNYKSKRFSKKR